MNQNRRIYTGHGQFVLIVCVLMGAPACYGEGTKRKTTESKLEISFSPESLTGMKYQAYDGSKRIYSIDAETAKFARRRIGFFSINIRDQLRMTGVKLNTPGGEIKADTAVLSLSSGKLSLETPPGLQNVSLKQLFSAGIKAAAEKSVRGK